MNQDKLEKYILDHRNDFDDQEPDPSLWDKIHRPEAPVVRFRWRDIAWKAAAVAAIFTASYFFHDFMATRHQPEMGNMADALENSPLIKELIEAEAYYTSLISQRRDEVFRLTAAYPDVRNEIDMELIELDKVFSDLMDDLGDNTDNEEVIEAMIQNYRLKLDILEEMLYRIKQSQELQNNTDHENGTMEL